MTYNQQVITNEITLCWLIEHGASAAVLEIITIEISKKSSNEVRLYPNPSNDKININWGILYNYSKGIPVKINIVNQFGVNVLSLESNMEELSSIDISSLGSGIYSLCINFEEVNFRYKILKL